MSVRRDDTKDANVQPSIGSLHGGVICLKPGVLIGPSFAMSNHTAPTGGNIQLPYFNDHFRVQMHWTNHIDSDPTLDWRDVYDDRDANETMRFSVHGLPNHVDRDKVLDYIIKQLVDNNEFDPKVASDSFSHSKHLCSDPSSSSSYRVYVNSSKEILKWSSLKFTALAKRAFGPSNQEFRIPSDDGTRWMWSPSRANNTGNSKHLEIHVTKSS